MSLIQDDLVAGSMLVSSEDFEWSKNAIFEISKIRNRVEYALARIGDSEVPRQLRAYTFLRLTTRSMLEIQRVGFVKVIPTDKLPTYRSISEELAAINPFWWNFCYFDESGFLLTDDRLIAICLSPLNDFVGWFRRGFSSAHAKVAAPEQALNS